MQKLVDQFDFDGDSSRPQKVTHDAEAAVPANPLELNEDRATLLYLIDTYNKHLIDLEGRPVRKVRDLLDAFARELVNPQQRNIDKTLFRFRQFFSSYRIDEYTYIQKTFDEFRNIIWDFVDQLAEDIEAEQSADEDLHQSLEQLKEAVDSNSIDVLRNQSRIFIDSYIEHQTKKDTRRSKKLDAIKKNLFSVKEKLVQAQQSMRRDHLTSAFNRRSFDEQLNQYWKLAQISKNNVTLVMLDIDHFKKFNDTYGHDIGDFILKECVKLLQNHFSRDNDFVARIGGEEFAVILPDHQIEHAVIKVEKALERIRREAFVQDDQEFRFTVSLGIAQLLEGETTSQWMKRADEALYESKNTGRNKYSIADHGESSAA